MTLGFNTYGVIYRVMYLLEYNMDGHIATAGTYTESYVRSSHPRAIVHIYTVRESVSLGTRRACLCGTGLRPPRRPASVPCTRVTRRACLCGTGCVRPALLVLPVVEFDATSSLQTGATVCGFRKVLTQ